MPSVPDSRVEAVKRMKAWARAHPECDTQGVLDDEWMALATEALDFDEPVITVRECDMRIQERHADLIRMEREYLALVARRDAVEGDRHGCRECGFTPCVKGSDYCWQHQFGRVSGGGVEASREDRSDLDIPFRRDEPDREMVRELGDRHTFPSGSIGERAILTLQEDVDALAEDKRELEARVVELKEALRDIAPLLLKAGFILPQHAIERDRLIEKHDAVLSAVLAAAGEGEPDRGMSKPGCICPDCMKLRDSGSRLPEQES